MIYGREIEIAGDLSHLPDSTSGARHLVWWGNIGFMLIEGTGFALAAAAYLYLMTQHGAWPPPEHDAPDRLWGAVFTVAMLLTAIPNAWLLRCARRKHLTGVRWGMLAMAILSAALMVPRALEFAHLNVAWHDDAYGSVIWLLLVLHTVHLVTEWGESAVLGVWLFTHDVGDDQFADVEDNANYWTFVILCWLPLYALVYWLPRAT